MINRSTILTFASFILIIAAVIGLSLFSRSISGKKPEKVDVPKELAITDQMTVAEFGKANNLPNSSLKEIFKLQAKSDLENKLNKYGTIEEIKSLVRKKLALASEHESKNWILIPVKFTLWFLFLALVFFFYRKNKVSLRSRRLFLLAAFIIFGVILGSDPSPLGTVKDAIVLLGSYKTIFPPRLIAMFIFLIIVFIANKYICAWGCQAGTLQDFIFHLNKTSTKKAGIGRQFKIPFVITNTIRIAFFIAIITAAFGWAFDIVEPIDPFKIYNPLHMGITGIIFVGLILIAGFFIYRPWCHFFCAFGLIGWLVEKISRFKISVNYDTCIACEKCAEACPSTVMGAILKRKKKTIPDCFACYTCRDTCPTQSISFSTRKRTIPPNGHFDKQKNK